jgi:hypothetical protein
LVIHSIEKDDYLKLKHQNVVLANKINSIETENSAKSLEVSALFEGANVFIFSDFIELQISNQN